MTADSPAKPRRWKTVWRWFVRWVALMTLAGIAVRLTLQDRFPIISVFYYATPLPLVLFGSVTMTVVSIVEKRHANLAFWLCLTIPIAIWWLKADWQFSAKSPSDDDIIVLFANTSHNTSPRRLIQLIQGSKPDIIGLAETHTDSKQFWESSVPGYQIVFEKTTLKLLSKKPMGNGVSFEIGHGTVLRECPVNVNGNAILCQIVDFTSNPFISRKPMLDRLTEMGAERTHDNLLIMGDFNTPADSIHFEPLRRQHQNLFEATGNGYQPTWPNLFPVLALDQMWINEKLEPISCEHHFLTDSDHLAVVGRFRVRSK